jgi:hypothetical protein
MVVGDIHQAANLDAVENAIAREAPDRIVFLGDYFDQWDDHPDDARRTANWLKRSLGEPNRIHLWGNHDLAYAFPDNLLARCPGYSVSKRLAIDDVLGRSDWARLQLTYWTDSSSLISHAGWSAHHAPPPTAALRPYLDEQEAEAWAAFRLDHPHWVWSVGANRGGIFKSGGLLWCDIDEFEPIEGIDQLFGHTTETYGVFRSGPRTRNWCVDTVDKTGVRHYLIWDAGNVTVFRLDGTPEPAWAGKGEKRCVQQ